MSATYLVTGGAGFIGSNLVRAVLGRGDRARVLDDFSTGRRANLAELAGHERLEVIEGDIRDAATAARAVDGADYVLHQAAMPSVPRSVADPYGSNDVNVSGTLRMLDAARRAGVRRFVFASSSSVYGESETLPKREDMPPAPISPYGLQKLCAESYCRLYHRLYGLPTVALRYFNVFGPRQDPASEYAAVIPRFVAAIRAGTSPVIYGDGEQTRDFNHVDNAVQANLRACEAPAAACGAAYNVGCGSRVSLNELVAILAELAGRRVAVEHAPPRPGDIRHSLASIDEAGRQLGYGPTVDLREGLRRLLAERA
jgi:nucleoside-diphosphate-sugar epimerase